MLLTSRSILALALLIFSSLANAQKTLGELLDAGASTLSAQDFQQEVVQRTIVGPTAAGGRVEAMYTSNGSIQAIGSGPLTPGGYFQFVPFSGEWSIDDKGRICSSFRSPGSAGPSVSLPARCQFWFKYADQYFLSDSDSDRSARVLSRRVKQ